MPLTPPPRMSTPEDAGSFLPAPSDGSGMPSQAPMAAEPSPSATEDTQSILAITSAARRLAMKYPTAVPEVQTINDAVQKLQMKIMMVQPPAEVAAPPQ